MAPGSENAAEVGPTDDVVQALMEKLVDPLLPYTSIFTNNLPSDVEQKYVARQMHAVVLLYNYYHRKKHPELEFLEFMSFCKLGMLLRPSLASFMDLTNKSMAFMELNGAPEDHRLSVTERAIKDACDIALALLDSSSTTETNDDDPNIHLDWPVSKVAVLLIDSNNENCMLQFGTITNGVWSLFEKELISKSEDSLEEELVEGKVISNKKRKTNNSLLKLAYDVVKDITGTDSSELVVLESHVAYSLTKEKSAAQFYIIQSPQTFNKSEQYPLKFLVESLEGPLAEKDFGNWTATVVVDHYHMLPYVGFITRWLLRKESPSPHDGYNAAQSTVEITPKREQHTPPSTRNDLDHIDINNISSTKTDSPDGNNNNNNNNKHKKCKNSSVGEVANGTFNNFNIFKKSSSTRREEDDADLIFLENLNKDNNEQSKNVFSSGLLQCDEIVEILDMESDGSQKDILSGPSRKIAEKFVTDDDNVTESKESDILRRTSPLKSEDTTTSKKLNSKIKVYHHKRKNMSSTPIDKHDKKVEVVVDYLKAEHTQCKDGKISREIGDVFIPSDKDETVVPENQLEIITKQRVELQNVSASEELQNALALLSRKRKELFSEICNMEDMLALCEHNFERISNGGDVDLARECIKSIISGNSNSHQTDEYPFKSQREKQSRVSGIFFPGRSNSQDLEYMCEKNNWRLPRYLVKPSGGKFEANVFVRSKDLELESKGSLKLNPSEARESAAAKMIANICKCNAASCSS